MASDQHIFIAIHRTKDIRIGDVFEQVPGGFYLLKKVPKRGSKTGQLVWAYERSQNAILLPFEQIAQHVIEIAKPEKGRPGFEH